MKTKTLLAIGLILSGCATTGRQVVTAPHESFVPLKHTGRPHDDDVGPWRRCPYCGYQVRLDDDGDFVEHAFIERSRANPDLKLGQICPASGEAP